jgi:hypothetical protein
VFVEFLQPLMDWVERGEKPGTLDAPLLSLPGFGVLREQTVGPVRSGT